MLSVEKDKRKINELKGQLSIAFEMKDLSFINWILGIDEKNKKKYYHKRVL
jgi:hypothetical protein